MPAKIPLHIALWSALALSAAAAAQVAYSPAPSTTVQLAHGRLQGSLPAPGVRAYLGIPYAKPPVGAMRWRPPQPYGSLSPKGDEPRLAVAHGSPCAQQPFGWNNRSAEHGTEDCLFLNVWAPVNGSKHPVMVYIHGGSNTAGSAAEELSNGFALVPKGVLLVTFDYRLGIFGFFRTEELDEESGYGGSGNYGLMDQVAALQWVHDNIAAFGGDPANVTLFGQSAGAVDTGLLMASPLARGLFQRAIEESGQVVGLMPTATRDESEQAWFPVANALGQDLAAMRQAGTAAVLAAEHNAPKPPPERFWGHRGASVDGQVLPTLPAEVFARGHEAPVPLLLGSNVQEIVPGTEIAAQTHHLIEDGAGPRLTPALEAIYNTPPANPLEGSAGARFQTDRDFRCPVRQVAAWHSGHGFPTFVYQFDRSAGSAEAARHSSELRFVFGFPPVKAPAQVGNTGHAGVPTGEDAAVAERVETLWTTFAQTGAPTPAKGLPRWPAYNAARGNYLHFESGSALPVLADHLGGASCSMLAGDVLPGSH